MKRGEEFLSTPVLLPSTVPWISLLYPLERFAVFMGWSYCFSEGLNSNYQARGYQLHTNFSATFVHRLGGASPKSSSDN